MVTLTTLSVPALSRDYRDYAQHPQLEHTWHTPVCMPHSSVPVRSILRAQTRACTRRAGGRDSARVSQIGTHWDCAHLCRICPRTGRAPNLPTPRAAQIPNHSIRGRYLDTDTGDLYYFHNASGAPTGAFSATAVRPRPLPCPRRARHAVRISAAAKGSSCCCEHAWGVRNCIRV